MPTLGRKVKRPARLSVVVIVILLIGVVLTCLNIYQLQQMREEHLTHRGYHGDQLTVVEGEAGRDTRHVPTVWIDGKHVGYIGQQMTSKYGSIQNSRHF